MAPRKPARGKKRRRRSTRQKSGGVLPLLRKIVFFLILLLTSIVVLLLVILFFAVPEAKQKNILFVPEKNSGVEERVILVELYPGDEEVIISSFDPQIKDELMGGYGEYKLGSIYKLLKIDKKDDQYIKAVFSHFLKRGVDQVETGVVDVDDKFSLMKLFISNKKTVRDAIWLKGLKEDQLDFIAVSNLNDWHERRSLNKKSLDQGCTVAVVNSTSYSGLANTVSDILENSGVEVVRATNNIWGDKETSIAVNKNSECLEVKTRVLSASPVILPETVDTAKTSQYRADVVLFIGDEFAESIEK